MAFSSSSGEVSHTVVPSSGQSWSGIETEIDKIAKDFVNDEKVPGMTVAISKDGRLIFNKAYGYTDFAEKKPMKTSHRTKIGSVSKILTTMGVMKLTEEKPAFTVDRLVYGSNGVFSDWRDYDTKNAVGKPEWYAKIRIKHLLSHTAGFNPEGTTDSQKRAFGIDPNSNFPYKAAHQVFLKYRGLIHEPGTAYEYANHHLGFSGHILAHVSGMSYEKYITNKILDPIGLKGKIIPYYSSDKPSISSLHSLDDNGKIIKISHSNSTVSAGLAAGGWTATAKDMVRVMAATDKLSNYSDILKASTIDLMETKPFPSIAGSHALGWVMSQRGSAKKLLHSGSIGGGETLIVKFTEGYTSTDGIDIGSINLAICTNRQGVKNLSAFSGKIAKVAGRANINSAYDLFPETLAKHGISEDKYQEIIDQLAPSGTMPVWIDFFEAENKVLVNAIFEPSKNRRWLARHNLTGEKYQEVFDKYVKDEGFRLTQIDAYTKNGQIRYACIMVKESGPEQHRYHGISEEKHQEKIDDLKSKGFVPVLMSVASISGKRYYTATYEKKNVGSWEARSKLTSAEYQQKFDENKVAGRKLAYLNAYTHNGVIYYSAIWQSEGGGGYVARHNLSATGYQDEFEKWRDAGYWVEMVTGACDSSGKSVFAALWRK